MEVKQLKDLVPKLLNQRSRTAEPVKYDFDKISEAVKYVGQSEMAPGKIFSFSGEREEFYRQMIYYFFNDPKFKGDLNKGLFIHGGKGTGKTVALKIFSTLSFNRVITSGKGFSIFNCDEVVTDFEVGGPATLQKMYDGNKGFDDLGDEDRPAFHYQKERNVMKSILTRRYRTFTDKGHLTFLTSNFNLALIQQEYKSRVEDRFHEMFNDISLEGKSLRK